MLEYICEDENLTWFINNLVIERYKHQSESERKRIRECYQEGIELTKEKNSLRK